MVASPNVDLHAIDVTAADAAVSIPRDALGDPWDRFILATARALALPLVTRDSRIQKTELVETVW
jgi:PIN domain nuclease of toxin-antitoxin system